jgi:hypothetical protein
MEQIKTKYLIIGSFLTGLAVGYVSCIRSTFSLSRVFVFFPFFVLGYCLSAERLKGFLDRRLRIPAVIFLGLIFGFNIVFWKQIGPVNKIIYGA